MSQDTLLHGKIFFVIPTTDLNLNINLTYLTECQQLWSYASHKRYEAFIHCPLQGVSSSHCEK